MISRNLRHNATLALILSGILFIALVLVDVGLNVYVIFHQDNQLMVIIAQGFHNGVTPILLLFIGAWIAIITSYFSSITAMEVEIEKNRNNVIIGFYYEIKGLNEKFKDVPVDNFTNCLAYLKRNKIRFYSENGLYFELKKELFTLDKTLLDKILSLYPKIIYIDEIIDFDATVSQPLGAVSADVINIHTYVNEVKPKLTELFILLESEKTKIEC